MLSLQRALRLGADPIEDDGGVSAALVVGGGVPASLVSDTPSQPAVADASSWMGSPEQLAASNAALTAQAEYSAQQSVADQTLINQLSSNPNSVKASGGGKVAVNPNSAGTQSLFSSLASGMTAGGNAYSAQQLMTTLANAMKTGQSLFVPASALTAAQKKPVASSSNDWLIAGGIGVAVLAVFAVIAMGRK